MFSLADQERAYSIHLKAETKEARKKAYVEAFEKAFKEGYIEMYGPNYDEEKLAVMAKERAYEAVKRKYNVYM